MNSIKSLMAEMTELLPRMDSPEFDPEVFARTGVFVVRGAIPQETINTWREEYYHQIKPQGDRQTTYNPVEYLDLRDGLEGIWRDPAILHIVSQVFGPNLGLFKRRFVVKDRSFRGNIFLHQDSPYQMGTLNKASTFIALTEAGPRNGGLQFYPGTFRFGFLGDAGEINRDILPQDWPVVFPILQPGDLALMHSLTWHESPEFRDGPDRIVTDFIYQEADDPSTIEVVAGEGGWEKNFLTANRGDDFQLALFQRSRTSTMKDLYQKLEALEKQEIS